MVTKIIFLLFLTTKLILPTAIATESGDGTFDDHSFLYEQTSSFLDDITERSFYAFKKERHTLDALNAEEYPFVLRTRVPHEVVIVDKGIAELELRLQMINKAKKSINYEMFLIEHDESTKIVMQHLMKKSREGVDVKILIDDLPLLVYFDKAYMAVLLESGIKIKTYNKSNAVQLFGKGQYRNHRKYISIDQKFALVTGRNQSNEYFNLGEKLNYYDRGILVTGPIVSDLDKQFNAFWQHSYTTEYKPKTKDIDAYLKWTKKERDYLYSITDDDLLLRDLINNHGEEELKKMPRGFCSNMMIISDLPGRGMKKKRLHREIFKRIQEARDTVLIESPSVILELFERDIFRELLQKNVEIKINTNTYMFPLKDAAAMLDINVSNDNMSYWNRKGVIVYTPTGKETIHEPQVNFKNRQNNSGWNIHTKSIIIDHKDFMIGSYNIDPRSKEFSSEMAIFCEGNKELTKEVEDLFYQRANDGVLFEKNNRPPGGFLKDTSTKTKILYNLQKPFVHLFKWLL